MSILTWGRCAVTEEVLMHMGFFILRAIVAALLVYAGVSIGVMYERYRCTRDTPPAEVMEEDTEITPFSTLTCNATFATECKKNFLLNNPEYEIGDIVYATEESVVYNIQKADTTP